MNTCKPKAQPRVWLKVKLMAAASETQEAQAIIRAWANARSTPRHLTRAIRLYQALLEGDSCRFWHLMGEFFPGFMLALHWNGMNTIPASPLVSAGTVQLDITKRTTSELLDGPDPFGLDELEI